MTSSRRGMSAARRRWSCSPPPRTAGVACSPIWPPRSPTTRRNRPPRRSLPRGWRGSGRRSRRAPAKPAPGAGSRGARKKAWRLARSRLFRARRQRRRRTGAARWALCCRRRGGAQGRFWPLALLSGSGRARGPVGRRLTQDAGRLAVRRRPLAALAGVRIRVRGVLDERFGPQIEIVDPLMLERLGKADATRETEPGE